ncbi:MAG: LPS export ABC transporter permease LptG [Candidatus Omnitrophota bacterium]|nr:MAG: LPS export ABC transporter permease LptG [Candidatus Omnitrophota bacterium]
MKIIDRYIVREFLVPFFYCLTVFISLYVVIDLCGRLEDILKHHVEWSVLLQYYGAFLPIIFVRTAPIAALLSTLYILGNLSKYNEIIALKATGLSIWRMVLPFFFLGIVISMATLVINDKIVPQANLVSATVKEEHLDKEKAQLQERIVENIALYGAHNRLIHVRKFYTKSNLLEEITILEQDNEERVIAKIQAKSAQWQGNKWAFNDCVVYNFNDKEEENAEPAFFKKMLIGIEEKPKDFLRREASAEFMNYQKLREYIRRLSGSGAKIVQKLLVDLHYKISFPFVSLIIIFLGIPFALSTQGTGKVASIGLSVVIAFFYYTVEALSLALGKGGTLPPIISAWFANFLFSTVAIMLMRRAPK